MNWCCDCVPVTVHLIGSGWLTAAPEGEQQSVTQTQTEKVYFCSDMEWDEDEEMILQHTAIPPKATTWLLLYILNVRLLTCT